MAQPPGPPAKVSNWKDISQRSSREEINSSNGSEVNRKTMAWTLHKAGLRERGI